MRAFIQFGLSRGPFQTCAVDDIEFRDTGIFVLWGGRWRRVNMARGRNYVNVGGQPTRICLE